MSVLEPGTAELTQLLVNAASHLSSLDGARRPLVPVGISIRRGRLHLGRLRSCLDGADSVAVAVGFAFAAWVGPPIEAAPNLGRLGYRIAARVDERGRRVLDVRVRNWLGRQHAGVRGRRGTSLTSRNSGDPGRGPYPPLGGA